jgi:hypothetical protein
VEHDWSDRDEAERHTSDVGTDTLPLEGGQQGGTRGSSNEGGPDRSGEPEKDQAVGVDSRKDAGSRSSQQRDDGPDARWRDDPTWKGEGGELM